MSVSTETDACRRQAELLERLGLLDAAPEAELDAVVRLAAAVTGVPRAAVNLLDLATQHTVSAHGFLAGAVPRGESLCAATLQARSGVQAFGDLAAEPCFRDNPWVDGRKARLRAYAGAPLVVEGTPIGTLCVFDERPHEFTAEHRDRLADLAALVVGVFHRRQQALQLAVLAVESEAARHQAEVAHAGLLRSEAFDRALLEALPVGVVATDADGRTTTVNRVTRQWPGLDERPVNSPTSRRPTSHAPSRWSTPPDCRCAPTTSRCSGCWTRAACTARRSASRSPGSRGGCSRSRGPRSATAGGCSAPS